MSAWEGGPARTAVPDRIGAAVCGILLEPLEYSVPNQRREADSWRVISRPDLGLAAVISDAISGSEAVIGNSIRSLRGSPSLLMFSDYGGTHKSARYEVFSYLVTTPVSLSGFDAERVQLRRAGLGVERRMSYKTLNDNVRLRSLTGYLEAADRLTGVLVSFAVDKRAAQRFNESYAPETAFGALGPWAARPFGKLSRVAHLAAIVVEGLRADGQDLIWITDEDEIAPNPTKHAEATRLLAHILSSYCTSDMGHFRFGTTASDPGDLLIEDLAAVPDLAAGSLNEILSRVGLHPDSHTPERLFIAADGKGPLKVRYLANWLSDSSSTLKKVNVVVDEGSGGCWVRRFSVVTHSAHRLT